MEEKKNYRRWYDNDIILSNAMKTLENSDDQFQIKVALNLIKVIIEHNISNNEYTGIDDILSAVEEGLEDRGNSRWYDIDSTLKTAIQMLEHCPVDVRSEIAKEMAKMVVEKIKDDEEETSSEE